MNNDTEKNVKNKPHYIGRAIGMGWTNTCVTFFITMIIGEIIGKVNRTYSNSNYRVSLLSICFFLSIGAFVLTFFIVRTKRKRATQKNDTVQNTIQKPNMNMQEMEKCEKCNKEIPSSTKFCYYCGNRKTQKQAKGFSPQCFCDQCGNALNMTSRFCQRCGKPRFGYSNIPVAPPPPPPPPPIYPNTPPPKQKSILKPFLIITAIFIVVCMIISLYVENQISSLYTSNYSTDYSNSSNSSNSSNGSNGSNGSSNSSTGGYSGTGKGTLLSTNHYYFFYATTVAENIVKDNLKYPKDAEFQSHGSMKVYYNTSTEVYTIEGYVYASNSFGVKSKNNFTVKCTLRVVGSQIEYSEKSCYIDE